MEVAHESPAPMMSANQVADGDEEDLQGLVSGVSIDLVDWPKKARPVECCLLTMSVVLLLIGMQGDDWLSGDAGGGRPGNSTGTALPVRAGLSGVTGSKPGIGALCTEGADPASVICVLTSAGSVAGGLGWTAFAFNIILGLIYVLQVLDERGLLAGIREGLPPSLPLDKAIYAPIACWSLLLTFVFLTLLAYALLAPASFGSGPTHLGSSYGAIRLALLVVLLGVSVHLSLVYKVGEDHVIDTLDSLRGHWGHMTWRQKLCQVLLLLALLCSGLLWLQRVEWGGLLIVYGVWSHSQNSHSHLSIFCCGAILSVCTDALVLASEPPNNTLIVAATWCLVLSKLSVVGILVYLKRAFV